MNSLDEIEIKLGINIDDFSLEELEKSEIVSTHLSSKEREKVGWENDLLKSIYIHAKKGRNLHSFLHTLSDEDLSLMADWIETRNIEALRKIIPLVTISLGLENPKKSFKGKDIEKFTGSFCVHCALVLFEKMGLNKITDKSKWWVPDGEITIELTDKFCEMNGLPKKS